MKNNMTSQSKEGWEERFEKKFSHDPYCEYKWWRCECSLPYRTTGDSIKEFIAQEVVLTKLELLIRL